MWGHSTAASFDYIDSIDYISIILIFGGSPCPFLWCQIAEIITNLANDILSCKNWDLDTLKIPHSNNFFLPQLLNKYIHFHPARPADVQVPPRKYGKVDRYIDNSIPVVIHEGDHASRAANVVSLKIHIVRRPVSKNEPISQDGLLSFYKLHSKGYMAKLKIVTGWTVNTRIFSQIINAQI